MYSEDQNMDNHHTAITPTLTCNNITTTIMFNGTRKKFIMVDRTEKK